MSSVVLLLLQAFLTYTTVCNPFYQTRNSHACETKTIESFRFFSNFLPTSHIVQHAWKIDFILRNFCILMIRYRIDSREWGKKHRHVSHTESEMERQCNGEFLRFQLQHFMLFFEIPQLWPLILCCVLQSDCLIIWQDGAIWPYGLSC